jgi:hypothetical protein
MNCYPVLVSSPLCATDAGNPLSYECYDFSPKEVMERLGGPDKFVIFHIYCEELKQLILDGVSNARVSFRGLSVPSSNEDLSPISSG